MALLLEAAAKNQEDDPRSDENNEHLRFKCLLIHERIEMIRNHLDVGLPLKVRSFSIGVNCHYRSRQKVKLLKLAQKCARGQKIVI